MTWDCLRYCSMIEDFFHTEDPSTRRDLERVDELVCGETFLKGLGKFASDAPSPKGFPVVSDIVKADELLIPSDLYELPEPWPYQELYGVIEEESGRIQYRTGVPQAQINSIFLAMDRKSSKFDTALLGRVDEIYKKEKVIDQFRDSGNVEALGEKHFARFSEVLVPHNIHAHVHYIILAAYYGGIDKSPLFKRMFEAFQTGGFPCGWLGPLPEDGGDPREAIAVLHFGQANEA